MGTEPTVVKTVLLHHIARMVAWPPFRWFRSICAGMVIFATSLWAIAALWFSSLPSPMSQALSGLYLLAVAAILVLPRLRRRALALCLLLFAAVLVPWLCLRPSNVRHWQPDVERTAYAEIAEGKIRIHNIRQCDYRTAGDFTVHYVSREYDLNKLRSADLYLVDWGLRHLAHTMVSFGFEGDQYICFSIETRKEVGEAYSAIRGFFRQYELICVAGDERDLVRLRANFRQGEEVRLYRLKPRNPEVVRAVFVEYAEQLNRLHDRPEWYNALTDNCMTSAYKLIRKHAVHTSWNWRIFLNGYVDELAYADGTIETSLPFSELRQRALINDRAKAAGDSPDFSQMIRTGIPGMEVESKP